LLDKDGYLPLDNALARTKKSSHTVLRLSLSDPMIAFLKSGERETVGADCDSPINIMVTPFLHQQRQRQQPRHANDPQLQQVRRRLR
jgi:hypothetical protein